MALNLTDPRKAIETFGLTALEAMSAGLPVIVPTVGGIAELVEDSVNGYKIDVRDLDVIADRINSMLGDKPSYLRLSASALAVSRRYDVGNMIDSIGQIMAVDL
nr:glycosyltransferase [Bacteroides sp. An269]